MKKENSIRHYVDRPIKFLNQEFRLIISYKDTAGTPIDFYSSTGAKNKRTLISWKGNKILFDEINDALSFIDSCNNKNDLKEITKSKYYPVIEISENELIPLFPISDEQIIQRNHKHYFYEFATAKFEFHSKEHLDTKDKKIYCPYCGKVLVQTNRFYEAEKANFKCLECSKNMEEN